MTIRYVESREVRGNEAVELLGVTVPEKGRLFVTNQFHNDWPDHSVSIYAKGADAVTLKGELRRFCNDCRPKTLNGPEINSNPATKNQLRWTPTGAIEPPQDSRQSPPMLRRALALFRR